MSKNQELTTRKAFDECTQSIREAFANFEKSREMNQRIVAVNMAKVFADKLYEAGGYTSIDAYAMDNFGIKKAQALSFVHVGTNCLREAPDGTVNYTLPGEGWTMSKAAEVAKLPAKTIADAVEAGTISGNSTQSELRAWAKGAKVGKDEAAVEIQWTKAGDTDSLHMTFDDWKAEGAKVGDVFGKVYGKSHAYIMVIPTKPKKDKKGNDTKTMVPDTAVEPFMLHLVPYIPPHVPTEAEAKQEAFAKSQGFASWADFMKSMQ